MGVEHRARQNVCASTHAFAVVETPEGTVSSLVPGMVLCAGVLFSWRPGIALRSAVPERTEPGRLQWPWPRSALGTGPQERGRGKEPRRRFFTRVFFFLPSVSSKCGKCLLRPRPRPAAPHTGVPIQASSACEKTERRCLCN